MSWRNSREGKRRRRLERKFRDDAMEAAAREEEERWERGRPGPVMRALTSAFLRSYVKVADRVPVDSLFTFLAFGPDLDGLEAVLKEEASCGEGFLEYARIRCATSGGEEQELMFVMTLSVCGVHNYRKVFSRCLVGSFHPLSDFLNSTFPFNGSCSRYEVAIVPEGKVVSSSSTPDQDDSYLAEFKRMAGVSGRQFLAFVPWEMLFKAGQDGTYLPVTALKEYDEEARRINVMMDSEEPLG